MIIVNIFGKITHDVQLKYTKAKDLPSVAVKHSQIVQICIFATVHERVLKL